MLLAGQDPNCITLLVRTGTALLAVLPLLVLCMHVCAELEQLELLPRSSFSFLCK